MLSTTRVATRDDATETRPFVDGTLQLRSVLPAALLLACVRPPAPVAAPAPAHGAEQRLAIFASADMRGQLTPCGCSEAMRGGIGKAAAQLAQARGEGLPTLYLDAGDTLFERTGFGADEVVGERRKARALADALRLMQLATYAPGPLDDALGAEFRGSLGLPELSPGQTRLLEVGGAKVGVVAGRDSSALTAGGRKLRESGAQFVVGLFGGTPAAAAEAQGVDVVVTGQAPETVGAEWDDGRLIRGSVPVVQVQSRGRSLVRIDVALAPSGGPPALARGQGDIEREFKAQGERLQLLKAELGQPGLSADRKQLLESRVQALVLRRQALAASAQSTALSPGSFTVRFIPLEAALPSDPSIEAVVAAYDKEVGELNLAWARQHGQPCPPPARGEAAYVGNEACRACHPAAFAVYERTGHAHAYATLQKALKQYRLDCIACHVVGFQQSGGVCRVDQVDQRRNVGCENCHGPGSLHVKAGNADSIPRRKPTVSTCIGCHTPENSIHFDFAKYLPRVLGPGHGARAD
jgi:hypothetical protein